MVKSEDPLQSELTTFLYHASHDLRGPLPHIQNMLDQLKAAHEPDCAILYTRKIEEQIRLMETRLTELGSIVFHHSQPVENRCIEIESVLDKISGELLKRYPYVKLITEIKRHSSLYGDCDRISIILKNIIANAFTYSLSAREYPLVQIRAHVTERSLIIQIEDNGRGIDKRHQKDIVKILYQTGSSDKVAGLGLYVAHILLRRLNGKIDVTSLVNSGTCVSLSIPNIAPTHNDLSMH